MDFLKRGVGSGHKKPPGQKYERVITSDASAFTIDDDDETDKMTMCVRARCPPRGPTRR